MVQITEIGGEYANKLHIRCFQIRKGDGTL